MRRCGAQCNSLAARRSTLRRFHVDCRTATRRARRCGRSGVARSLQNSALEGSCMSLKEYKPGTSFPGRVGRTIGESEPAWPAPQRAKAGAPNVLFVVIDDTGFGQFGCYGSPIHTPTLDKLRANGLLY